MNLLQNLESAKKNIKFSGHMDSNHKRQLFDISIQSFRKTDK